MSESDARLAGSQEDPGTDDTPVNTGPTPGAPSGPDEAVEQLLMTARGDGIVAVQGPQSAIEQFAERAQAVIGSPRLAQATQLVSMLGSGVDAIPGVGEDSPAIYQFSQRAMQLLRDNNLIAGEDGFFRSAVAGGDVTGNLDWLPVPTGADVIQLQTAAVGIALHASIKNLADAVERVENRLDELRDLVRSGQVGEVLGHHRVLTERLAMIEDQNGHGLGDTDWMAIAHLHPHIVSGLERTRFFIRSRMGMTEPGRMVRSRLEASDKLIDANLGDALGLLATCEHNLAGWQSLRLDRVIRTEPGHLDAVVTDMDSSLALHRNEDQALVNDLVDMMNALMEPTGLEGLEVIKRGRLIRNVEQIHAATATFARQRGLALPHLEHGELPSWLDSMGMVAGKARDGGKWTFSQARRGGGATRRILPGGRKRRTPPPPNPAQRSPD